MTRDNSTQYKWPDHKRSCMPHDSLIFYHQTAIEKILAEEYDKIGVLRSCVWQQWGEIWEVAGLKYWGLEGEQWL